MDWEQFGIDAIQGPMFPFFEYQQECIEHQDAEVPIVSYYTEAVGDVFREVSKWKAGYHSTDYITEKLYKRLKSILDWNVMDEKDKQRLITAEKKQVLREFEKKINKFLEITRVGTEHQLVPVCKGYENIRTVQEKSVWLLKDLIKWGLDEKSTSCIKVDILDFIKNVETLLNIPEERRK